MVGDTRRIFGLRPSRFSAAIYTLAISLNPTKHCTPAEFPVFGDRYIVYEILLTLAVRASAKLALDGCRSREHSSR